MGSRYVLMVQEEEVTAYGLESYKQGEELAQKLNEMFIEGGHPDSKAWIIDLSDPKSFGVTQSLIIRLREWARVTA